MLITKILLAASLTSIVMNIVALCRSLMNPNMAFGMIVALIEIPVLTLCFYQAIKFWGQLHGS